MVNVNEQFPFFFVVSSVRKRILCHWIHSFISYIGCVTHCVCKLQVNFIKKKRNSFWGKKICNAVKDDSEYVRFSFFFVSFDFEFEKNVSEKPRHQGDQIERR